jgi:nucleoside-triphosphatase THEP1
MARWALLIGPKGCGKSNDALELIRTLRACGLTVAGFVQVGWIDALERKGYDLQRITDGTRMHLARPGSQEGKGEEAFCSFVFNQDAFETARGWVQDDAPGAQVVFFDEVSKLEAAGKGHHGAIAWAMARPDVAVVVTCVRADQLFYVMEKFKLEEEPFAMLEVPTDQDGKAAFAEEIVRACQPG